MWNIFMENFKNSHPFSCWDRKFNIIEFEIGLCFLYDIEFDFCYYDQYFIID